MRHVLASMLLALVTGLVACAGSEARGPDLLFDSARADVHKFKGEDGRDIGLVNTTHRVVWDYERGYSRFAADREIVWGPLASFPDGELASMQAKAPHPTGDGVGSTSSAMSVGAGGSRGFWLCTCCYFRVDKTCGCLDCRDW
jgi:hypothetical protein